MLRRLLRRLALFQNTRRERRDLIPRGNQIVEDFHRLYFNDVFDKQLRANWLGVEVLKYPTDLLVYQEIIHEIGSRDGVPREGPNLPGRPQPREILLDLQSERLSPQDRLAGAPRSYRNVNPT